MIRGLASAALLSGGVAGGAHAAPGPASEVPAWQHGIALLGGLKYPAQFANFDYVNMRAPKAGMVRRAVVGTYDSFNLVVAGVKGDLAEGIDLIYDTLMVPSLDEVASEYGLIAEAACFPKDFSWVSFRLRPEAKWHDGSGISVEDVIFSLETFKRLHPQLGAYYRHVVKAEKIGEHEVRFTFDAPGIRELPQVLGQLTVLPRHWWDDESSERRDITQTTLEAPLGSGPYRIKMFEAGRSIVYERVKDYWAKGLPANIGTNNFDELRFDYFRDPSVAFEAFKAGTIDWRIENTAKNWATEYDFPAVQDKQVSLEEFPIRSIGTMQAFAFNTRRSKFQDPRVRRAFNFAFDFETVNHEVFLHTDFELFRRHRAGLLRPAKGPRTRVPASRPLRCPAGGLHHALLESGQPKRYGVSLEFAGSDAFVERSRLRGKGSCARRSANKSAVQCGISDRQRKSGAGHSVLSAGARAPWHACNGAAGRRRAIPE